MKFYDGIQIKFVTLWKYLQRDDWKGSKEYRSALSGGNI